MATCSSADSVLNAATQIKSNATKLNDFVNGGADQTVQLGESTDTPTPTLRNLVENALEHVAESMEDSIEAAVTTLNELESGKADKVNGNVEDHIAALDMYGNLQDSGIDMEDVAIKSVDIANLDTDKADKVSSATSGHLAGLNASGNLTDSGIASSDVALKSTDIAALQASKASKVSGATAGDIAVFDASGDLADSGVKPADKADRVSGATSGHFAGLNSGGNLTDSGKSPADIDNIEAKAVMSRGWISSTTTSDFNDLTTPGMYSVSSLSGILHTPPTSSDGTLIVYTGASSGNIIQSYVSSNGEYEWDRGKNVGGWQDWTMRFPKALTVMSRGWISSSNTTDFNLVTTPGMYVVSSLADISNAPPTSSDGTLMVFSGGENYIIQSYRSSDGSYEWCRGKNAGGWQSWTIRYPESLTMISRGWISSSTTTDFNDVTAPGVYTVSSLNGISNTPPTSSNGSLIVLKGSSGGIIQSYVSSNGEFEWRRGKDSSGWQDWTMQKTSVPAGKNFNNVNQFVAPYDDMNTFPSGVYVSSVTWSDVENYPANIPSGTLIVTNFNGRESDESIGTVQLMFGGGAYWGKMAWRSSWYNAETWSPWIYNDEGGLSDADCGTVAMFETIGIVGDSFASGSVCTSSGTCTTCYPLSWGQVMARRNGIECTNFSVGGLTTRTWLTSARGKTLLLSESAKNLYILALGINDYLNYGTEYIGSSSDIETDYNDNADTFWGNYSKIISIIKEHAPNAKLILSTMAGTGDVKTQYNAAIADIADYWDIPLIVQNDDAFFVSGYYSSNMIYGHPVGVMYSGMALAFERLIAKCFKENISYFADYTGNI